MCVYSSKWSVLLDDTVGHFQRMPVSMLFVQGGRDDEFADLDELDLVLNGLGSRAVLQVTAGADHSYDLQPGSSNTKADTLAEIASVTVGWMRSQLQESSNAPLPPSRPTLDGDRRSAARRLLVA